MPSASDRKVVNSVLTYLHKDISYDSYIHTRTKLKLFMLHKGFSVDEIKRRVI